MAKGSVEFVPTTDRSGFLIAKEEPSEDSAVNDVSERGKLKIWERVPGLRILAEVGRKIGTAFFDGIEIVDQEFQKAEQSSSINGLRS